MIGTETGISVEITIDFEVAVQLPRIAGRIGFVEPEVKVSGEVRRDYYDMDDDQELAPTG